MNIAKYDRNPPDVDWDAVALASGYKNAETVKVRYRQIKIKLGLVEGPPGSSPAAAAAAAKQVPNDVEAKLFANITKFSRQKPYVDWEAVAAASGFKNAETAKVVTYLALPVPHVAAI